MSGRMRVAGAVGVAMLVCALVILVWRSSTQNTELTAAARACEPDNDTVSASDDGDELNVAGDGPQDATLTTEASACVLAQLAVPDDVQSAIRTTAADGESRSERFEDYEIAWTKSRSGGLELTVRIA